MAVGVGHATAARAATLGSAVAIGISGVLLAILIGVVPRIRPAAALPLYARQTGLVCASCHTAFFELTPFGRRFKLNGYTLGGGKSTLPPFSVMLQPTFTHTAAGQPGGAAPGFGPNECAS